MPIKEEAIQVGKCYRTRGGEKDSEKYTVLNITRGIVTYQSWTTDPNRLSLRTNTGIKALAEVIFKEIPCPTRDPTEKLNSSIPRKYPPRNHRCQLGCHKRKISRSLVSISLSVRPGSS